MSYEPLDPCDNCYSAPAVKDGLCHGCLVQTRADTEYDDDADYWPDDDAANRAQNEWEKERTREPR